MAAIQQRGSCYFLPSWLQTRGEEVKVIKEEEEEAEDGHGEYHLSFKPTCNTALLCLGLSLEQCALKEEM